MKPKYFTNNNMIRKYISIYISINKNIYKYMYILFCSLQLHNITLIIIVIIVLLLF